MNNIENAIKRARKFFEYHELKLPVDIEAIIKKYADITEDYIPIKGDAICINNINKPQIIIKSNMSKNRKRFTYAHELAHIQIPSHTGMLSCYTSVSDYDDIDIDEYSAMEKEANAFAAELLMPSNWIKSKILSNSNLKEVIESICSEAKVSFMAAVYNVISACPEEYVFLLINKIENIVTLKYSGIGSRPIIFYNNGVCDLQWLECNSVSSYSLKDETMDVAFFKFKQLCSQDQIMKIVDRIVKDKNLNDILNAITENQSISYAHLISDLQNLLPEGYIIKIKCLNSGSERYFVTEGTYVNPKRINENEYDLWYSNNSIRNGHSKNSNIELKIWNFQTAFNIEEYSYDERDSKIILREMVECFYTGKERASAFGRINGVIGALKNNIVKDKIQQKEFYNILKQKFVGIEDIENITEHMDFDVFLAKKTKEIFDQLES